MFLSTGGIRGRARQETHNGMTLINLSILAVELCPYSPRMSRVAPSDGTKNTRGEKTLSRPRKVEEKK